jgi:hypothetical protein
MRMNATTVPKSDAANWRASHLNIWKYLSTMISLEGRIYNPFWIRLLKGFLAGRGGGGYSPMGLD